MMIDEFKSGKGYFKVDSETKFHQLMKYLEINGLRWESGDLPTQWSPDIIEPNTIIEYDYGIVRCKSPTHGRKELKFVTIEELAETYGDVILDYDEIKHFLGESEVDRKLREDGWVVKENDTSIILLRDIEFVEFYKPDRTLYCEDIKIESLEAIMEKRRDLGW